MVKRRAGTTLIELMIVVAIFGAISLSGFSLYKQIRRFFFLSTAKASLQRDARDVMYILSRRLRQARSSSLVIDQVSGQPPYSRISFTDIDGNNIKYYQTGRSLYMVDVSTRALTKDLRYLAFSLPRSDDMGILSLSFTLEKQIYEGQSKALHMASEKVRINN